MRFPSSVGGDTTDLLRRDVVNALQTVTSVGQATLLIGQAIGTTSTPIRHGLSSKPRAVFAIPTTNVTVYKIAAPDATYVYLAASVAASVDIMVIP